MSVLQLRTKLQLIWDFNFLGSGIVAKHMELEQSQVSEMGVQLEIGETVDGGNRRGETVRKP